MKQLPELSIVIGSYKNKRLTISLINSIYRYSVNVNFEIIVIDDSSPDEIYEYIKKNFKNIRTYRNKKNLGYSKTYNKGSRLAKGRYILHLNADTIFTNKTKLLDIVKYMDTNPKVGMLGNLVLDHYSKKLDPDNRHQVPTIINAIGQSLGIYKFFPSLKDFNYYMTYLKEDEISEVGGVGGFMFFKKDLLKNGSNVGLLIKRYVYLDSISKGNQ